MAVTLTIPDSVLEGLRLPEGEIESRLRLELAIALYSKGVLSLGKAAELSETSRFRMAEMTADRGIPRQYGEEDLADDLKYARGE